MKNKTIIIFIIGVLVVIGGLFVFNAFLKKNVVNTEDQTQEENITETEILPFVVVPEQAGGTNVFIENATLPLEGYVVIHKEENGKPGVIIGVSDLLSIGTTKNFLIDTDEKVKEGDSLFAVLHKDNGDQEFSGDIDLPLTDNEGNIVLVLFEIVGEGALDNEIKL